MHLKNPSNGLHRLALINRCVAVGVFTLTHLTMYLVQADVIEVNSVNAFRSALNSASDGDEILLAPGSYAGGFFSQSLTGVTIRSADPDNAAVINAASFGEGIKLQSADRITIADLIIENASENGINIDDSGFVTPSTNITLRNITVRSGGGHAIKLTGVDGFDISRATITDWGNGFAGLNLLGAHDGIVRDSLIQRNNASDGFGIKAEAGSANVVIRGNRFVNAGERAIQFGGSVALQTFRPQPPGDVAADNIVAEGNVIVGRGTDAGGIQSAVAYINIDDAVFRNNLVFRPSLFAGRILKENNNPGFVDTQDGVFQDNIILWHNGDLFAAPINVGVNTLPETFSFRFNTWLNVTNPASSFVELPSPDPTARFGVDPGVGPHDAIPWEFDWGTWLVNATEIEQTVQVDPSFMLATPNAGAELDLGLTVPLLGDWTLSPLDSPSLELAPFSQAVLVLPNSTPADYNKDQFVSAADYTVWRDTLASTIDLRADGNGNELIDAGDYTVWKSTVSQAMGDNVLQIALVPETSSAALCSLGILAILLTRKRRQ